MPNATDLYGYTGVTQPCIIVPWPEDSSLYYIFTIDRLKFSDLVNYTTQGLCVTVIDMKLRNGLGDAQSTVLNKQLLAPVAQKLTAVKHRNGKDFWVIVHEWDNNKFDAFHITPYGMESPVVSSVGSIHGGNRSEVNNSLGYMKASPDGNKLALAITQKKVIELFDFNNETGVVSNPQTFTTTVNGINPYGIEFSPDSHLLYATVFEIGGVEKPVRPSYIYQFEIKSGLTNPVVVDSISGVRIAAMQLATDGRIYLSRTNNHQSLRDSLEVIYDPNRPGKSCNLNLLDNIPGNEFPLMNRKSAYSLPNFVQSFVNIPTFTWENVCQGDATRFNLTNEANIDSINWNFDDGGSASVVDPVYSFASPGKYWVKTTEFFNGEAFTDSLLVTNYRLPQIGLADTMLIYTGSTINLHAGGGFMEYTWSTKSKDSIITVKDEGDYWVKVKDYQCCINSDTTYLKVFQYFIPNAFTPNGDGLNDIFKVNGLYKNINFNLVIYDRWGRFVFESTNIDSGWDGTVGGTHCEPDAYVWVVKITFKGQDIVTDGDVKFKGTVTLVR
jgi:gliding motility-associated-like protein